MLHCYLKKKIILVLMNTKKEISHAKSSIIVSVFHNNEEKCPYVPVRSVESTVQQAVSHTLDEERKVRYIV